MLPYAPAQRELAKMMPLGQGGDKDIPGAVGWLERAGPTDKEATILLAALRARGFAKPAANP